MLIYHESIYLKQTGPMSKPNSCSAPPMSKGAMSRMGRRDGLFVLYSITVLLHSPVCLCGGGGEKRKKASVYGGGKRLLGYAMGLCRRKSGAKEAKELLTVQPSSSTEKVKRLLPSALSSTSLEPWSTTAFFMVPVSPSMYATLFLQW